MAGLFRRRGVWAILLILLLALGGYGFLLRPGRILYSPYSDILAQHLATKTVLHRSLQSGHGIPFWRDDQLCGTPALTHPQSLYTYPLHFLFFLMSPADAMDPTLWLHFLAAGLAFYALGAALKLGTWPRLLMAAAGMFNFKLILITYAGWLPVIPGAVFVPLLIAAALHLSEKPSAGRALLFALAGAVCLHGGHLQVFYYGALFLVAFFVIRGAGMIREKRAPEARRLGLWLACAALLAAGLTAYLMIPMAAESPLISRGAASYEFFLAKHEMQPAQFLTFLYPEALGTPLDGSYARHELWEDAAYFGIIPLILAAFGAAWGRRRPNVKFLAAAFLVSILLAMNTPLLRALYEIVPGYRLFRCPGRMLFMTALFGIALAGVGAEEALARIRNFRRPKLAAALVVGLTILIAAEGICWARRYLVTAPQKEVLPTPEYAQFFADDRSVYRVAPLSALGHFSSIPYGWAAPLGLQLVTGFDAYNFKHYEECFQEISPAPPGSRVWFDLHPDFRTGRLGALNVKYIVAPHPLGAPGKAMYEDQPVFLFYKGMAKETVDVYRSGNFLPRACFRGDAGSPIDSAAGDRVEILAQRDGYLELRTSCAKERELFISEIWHPGWRATCDGENLPLRQADIALMSATAPAGQHEILLRFRPLYWTASLSLTLLSGAAFLGLAAACLIRSRRENNQG